MSSFISDKSQEDHKAKKGGAQKGTFQLKDNRLEAQKHLSIQELANKSTQSSHVGQLQKVISGSQKVQSAPLQMKQDDGGLPPNIKSNIENHSGHSLDDVKVHYNSQKPAQLNAHAFAQGNDIHIASGQEKHLPHEAWHVVQQKQGRVQPTKQLNGVNINDNKSLETEADKMGDKVSSSASDGAAMLKKKPLTKPSGQAAQLVDSENEAEEEAPPKDTRTLKEVLADSQKTLTSGAKIKKGKRKGQKRPPNWKLPGKSTTKGYELEFARVSAHQPAKLEGLGQLMRGATHAEYYASKKKVGGLPIKIEGDAAGKLELVTPPLVVAPSNRVHVFSTWSHMTKRAASKKTLGSAKAQIESETGFALAPDIKGIRSWFLDYRHGTGSKGSFKLGAESAGPKAMRRKVNASNLAEIQIGPLGGAAKSKLNIHVNEAIKSGNIQNINFYKKFGAKAKKRKSSHIQYEKARRSIGMDLTAGTNLKIGIKSLIGRQVGSYIVDTATLGNYKKVKDMTKQINFIQGKQKGVDKFAEAENVGNLDSSIKDRSKIFLKIAWEDVIMKEIPKNKRAEAIQLMIVNAASSRAKIIAAAKKAGSEYWAKPTGKARTHLTEEQRQQFINDTGTYASEAVNRVIVQLHRVAALKSNQLLKNSAEFGEGGGLLAVRPDTLIRPVKSGKNRLYVIERRGRRLRYPTRVQED